MQRLSRAVLATAVVVAAFVVGCRRVGDHAAPSAPTSTSTALPSLGLGPTPATDPPTCGAAEGETVRQTTLYSGPDTNAIMFGDPAERGGGSPPQTQVTIDELSGDGFKVHLHHNANDVAFVEVTDVVVSDDYWSCIAPVRTATIAALCVPVATSVPPAHVQRILKARAEFATGFLNPESPGLIVLVRSTGGVGGAEWLFLRGGATDSTTLHQRSPPVGQPAPAMKLSQPLTCSKSDA